MDLIYKIRVKPVTTTSKTPNIPKGRDTFETPDYAIDLLLPFIPGNIFHIWECACGGGKIVRKLRNYGYDVLGSDIREVEGVTDLIMNFLDSVPVQYLVNDGTLLNNICIITNPPYSIKEMFIERAFELEVPFAFLINADYSGKQISWIKRGCEKIIPDRRIDYITPTGRQGKTSSSQFHSMWLTYGFNLGRTETFVELTNEMKKDI